MRNSIQAKETLCPLWHYGAMPSRLIIAYVLIAVRAAVAAAVLVRYLRMRRERQRILRGHSQRRQNRH